MAQKEASLLIKIKTAGEEALGKLKENFAAIAGVATAAFAAISAVVVKSIAEYQESEEAVNSLSRAMANQGMFSAELRKNYLDQAEALQGLTKFGDDQIVQAQAALQQQIGHIAITKELTQAILDFATAQKMDAVSAAQLVGKSIGSATNALGRYGIEVDSTASKSDKMAQVIEGLNGKFGGQAAAAAQGLGALTQLKNAIGEVFEAIGKDLAPTVVVVTRWMLDWAKSAQGASDMFSTLGDVFNWLAKQAVTLAAHIDVTGKELGVNLAAGIGIAKAAMTGDFDQIKMLVQLRSEELNEIQVNAQKDLDAKLTELSGARREREAQQAEQDLALLQESLARKHETVQLAEDEAWIAAQADRDAKHQEEMMMIGANEEQKLQARITYLNKRIESENNAHTKRALMEEKYRLQDQQKQIAKAEAEKNLDEQKVRDREATLSTIATLQRSNNAQMAAIGKAAAITQIAIETPVAIARAIGAFPPPANFVAAGLVGAAMAAQAAQIAGVPLAEGGIVKATPGGVPAIIGEGGRDEAVIPLDKAGNIGGGNNITIIVNGGLLGDESSAHQLAVAIDRQLLRLRQNNESVAFDEGVV